MFMRKKAFILMIVYFTATVLALGGYSLASGIIGENYRNTAVYGYEHTFGEVVTATHELSEALHRAAYTTGTALSTSVCADIYADCLTANMTLAALPFSTQELEQTAGFISIAGNYAHTLLKSGKESGFASSDRDNFMTLYKTAKKLTDSLTELQGKINNGELVLDDPENVFISHDEETLLSSAMLKLEDKLDLSSLSDLNGGNTQASAKKYDNPISEEKARELAAEFLGAEKSELNKQYRSESGGTCFELDGTSIVVDGGGNVLSVSSKRTVTDGKSADELEKAALGFLKKQGFSELHKLSEEYSDGVLYLKYCLLYKGTPCEGDCIKIGIAADDLGLYSYDATAHVNAPEHCGSSKAVSIAQAKSALPDNVCLVSDSTVYVESADGERLCYAFSCTADNGDKLSILVDAETGRQLRIDIQ